ncbi:hypothetical protein [Bradyrhizobium acaciae]|uniref:hypothetical protein n=1 Tax=Bradyrhizobium acaciae TaxID=2683706 RepID=UPI001E4C2B41|nr:hypothetical protein [Bradyrhizobium acaciae]MCC8984493.1 hypothetical protein [Bradyrhizobium acaciae]
MSTIFDMLYHEYCRARLAEMRKQLSIPVIGEILHAPSEDGDPSGPHDRGWTTEEAATTR